MRTPFAAALCGLVVAVPASAGLYSQPNDETSLPSFFSDAVPGQFFSQRMADNFTLDAAGTMTGIRWWGGSQNFNSPDLDNMASWTVLVLGSDGSGAPDLTDVVFSTTVDEEESSATQTGNFNSTGGIEYEHTISFAGVALDAGTQYWISVGATLEVGGGDAWVWSRSSVGDLVNATDFFDGGGFTVFNPTFNDLAFEIIPAPSGAVALTLAGIATLRRKR